MSFRRMLPFILINIVVSTAVVLSILFWWNGRQGGAETAVVESGGAVSIATPTSSAGVVAEEGQVVATETAVATEAPPFHIIQAGETLGSISALYDVPMEDIMEANGITNANVINVGQQLVIPINGLEEPTPIPQPTEVDPDVIPTPINTLPPPEGGEAVVTIDQVAGVGELAAEAIRITNEGESSVALQGWKIADQDGLTYTFTQLTLFGGGAGVILHTDGGTNSATDVYWGAETAVWESGELVTLLDANGDIVDTYTIP